METFSWIAFGFGMASVFGLIVGLFAAKGIFYIIDLFRKREKTLREMQVIPDGG
jgi:NhaP-type Na+/H+ or K+/H+ antiporter